MVDLVSLVLTTREFVIGLVCSWRVLCISYRCELKIPTQVGLRPSGSSREKELQRGGFLGRYLPKLSVQLFVGTMPGALQEIAR